MNLHGDVILRPMDDDGVPATDAANLVAAAVRRLVPARCFLCLLFIGLLRNFEKMNSDQKIPSIFLFSTRRPSPDTYTIHWIVSP